MNYEIAYFNIMFKRVLSGVFNESCNFCSLQLILFQCKIKLTRIFHINNFLFREIIK